MEDWRQFEYRFGSAEHGYAVFRETRLELLVDGQIVKLEPKPRSLLNLLLRHHGAVVHHQTALSTIWGTALGSEGRQVLYNAIGKLRRALGEHSIGKLIVSKRSSANAEGGGVLLTGEIFRAAELGGVFPSTEAQSEALTRFTIENMLGMADPYGSTLLPVAMRDVLKRAVANLDVVLPGQTRMAASIRGRVAGLLHKYEDSEAALSEWNVAIALLTELDGRAAPQTLQARYRAASTVSRGGDFAAAESWLLAADSDAASLGDPLTAVLADCAWGEYHLNRQQLYLAATRLERARRGIRQLLDPPEEVLESIAINLAFAYSGAERFIEAIKLGRELLQSLEKRQDVGRLSQARAMHALGQALMFNGDLDEATLLLTQAADIVVAGLGAASPSAVMMRTRVSDLYVRKGEIRKAIEVAMGVYEALRETPPKPRWMLGATLANVGILQAELGQFERSLVILHQAEAGMVESSGPEPWLQYIRWHIVVSDLMLGRATSAKAYLHALEASSLRFLDPDVAWPQSLALARGVALSVMGDSRAASESLKVALAQIAGVAQRVPATLVAKAKKILRELESDR